MFSYARAAGRSSPTNGGALQKQGRRLEQRPGAAPVLVRDLRPGTDARGARPNIEQDQAVPEQRGTSWFSRLRG